MMAGFRDAIHALIQGKTRLHRIRHCADAMSDGSLPRGDAAALAETLYLYVEGAMSHARIRNDLDLLKGLEENGLRLIGFQPANA
jgi:hypothetical protein